MGNTQVANRGSNGNSADIHIIVKNVPTKDVSKIVNKVVKDIKDRNPKSTVSVITGPSHKMEKLEHGSDSNQPRISSEPTGGEK